MLFAFAEECKSEEGGVEGETQIPIKETMLLLLFLLC